MGFQQAKPSEFLQPYIRQYWSIQGRMPEGETHTQRIVATELPELTCYLGSRPRSEHRVIEANTVLNGQQNEYYDLQLSGEISLFTITFQPQGLSRLLSLPQSELHNQTVAAELVDKTFLPHLEERLAAATNFQDRVRIAETMLTDRLGKIMPATFENRMDAVIDRICTSRGNFTIDELAEAACLSRKQFERKFLSAVGISPKQYQRIIRFQHSLFLNQTRKFSTLTELAHEAGFYDQSHFTNEIRELTGLTPKKLFETGDVISDFFTSPPL